MTAAVTLGALTPNEVDVELYYGHIESIDSVKASQSEIMHLSEEPREEGRYLYQCRIVCQDSGRYGFTVRVTPHGDTLLKISPSFIAWAG